MATLSREHRRLLENTVAQARAIAEAGARKVLRDQYAVHSHEPWPHMKSAAERKLRNQLRAHGRQLGDRRDAQRGTQSLDHLVQACAYEHWHRMLFARFLAENDLLLDPDHRVPVTLKEVQELARERNVDWLALACDFAQRMLLEVFRPDDPVLQVVLPPETRQQLEERLLGLPKEVFTADDSLGWVYQFWQRDEKERVNKSAVKIGADELAAVTQLFTEDYMVLFLLENTLGAWWAGKVLAASPEIASQARAEDELRAACSVGGYNWTYLRFVREGEDGPWRPAAGTFDGWPRKARDLKVLDPCEGSGHFLVFALRIMVAFRANEDGLSPTQAVEAVVRDNLFGLELDNRCTQIAAFNLALAAWRMVGYRLLPPLNIACSGLGINAKEEDWLRLAGKDERARETMRQLYQLFQQAPVLGSLINPKRVGGDLFTTRLEKVRPMLERALDAEGHQEATAELAIAARGVLEAARILGQAFTLVSTNVPYLKRGKQDEGLKEHCARFYAASKGNLGCTFVERCLEFCPPGGSVAVVTINELLTLTGYTAFRRELLTKYGWDFAVRLGPGAFESISGAVVSVALLILTKSAKDAFGALDASRLAGVSAKKELLRATSVARKQKADQLGNPDARIILGELKSAPLLSARADFGKGSTTGDSAHYLRLFFELNRLESHHVPWLDSGDHLWGGRSLVSILPLDNAQMRQEAGRRIHGQAVWGRRGVAVGKMNPTAATLYTGEVFDDNVGVLAPHAESECAAILAYCQSDEYESDLRQIDQTLKVTAATLSKVPFDVEYWHVVALDKFPPGLPKPYMKDPTQWLFNGHPRGSDHPLQVAVARLVGYRWPRQTGSSFPDCPALSPDGLEKHADSDGVVCLTSLAGKASAADRLRALLADAYSEEWSAAKLAELLGGWESLDLWLRDCFFEEHCEIFHQRPFVWHVWDGRKDGFNALVNYHKLAGPNGEGRKTLEKLIYTALGDWITRQRAEVGSGVEGADARLTAALHLKSELEKILEGEKPYDIFVRWKPIHEQPIGWEPDFNDGVRLNIRPWLTAKPYQPSRRDACILRVTPRITYGKDRGKEPLRPKQDFPWFWSWDGKSDGFKGGREFDGARWNDLHYSLEDMKKKARERQQAAEARR